MDKYILYDICYGCNQKGYKLLSPCNKVCKARFHPECLAKRIEENNITYCICNNSKLLNPPFLELIISLVNLLIYIILILGGLLNIIILCLGNFDVLTNIDILFMIKKQIIYLRKITSLIAVLTICGIMRPFSP